MPDHWKKSLSTLTAAEIEAGGLTLYTVAPSKTPNILDAENEALKTRCNDLLHGLLIQGVPQCQRALSMTGAHVEGEVQIRKYAGGKDRVQTFAVASPETWATLIEMYDLRGAVEHVNSLLEAVVVPEEVPLKDAEQYRIARMNRLTRHLDVLVRFVLVQISERADLFDTFRTEDSIDAFGSLQDRERTAAWGKRLDVRKIG